MRDPDFVESLLADVKKGASPVQPLQKTLTKMRLPDYVRPALRRSFLSHTFIFISALLYGLFSSWFGGSFSKTQLTMAEQKSAIRVEVLDLPSQKLSDLRKVDLSEKAVEKVKEPELPKDAMVLEKKQNKEKIEKARKELRVESRRKQLMSELLDKEEEPKAEVGRARLAGNILSEGYSLTGDVATDREVHSGKVKDHVMKFWKVPSWMAASKQYRAEIVVKIDPKGKVISKQLVAKSGNDEFDHYAVQAIQAADPFPPPPDSLKMIYLEEGILCAFPK